jgi:hypothetical protein
MTTGTCKTCGKPTSGKYCRACIDKRLGVVVNHKAEFPERYPDPAWRPLGDGGFQRARKGETL